MLSPSAAGDGASYATVRQIGLQFVARRLVATIDCCHNGWIRSDEARMAVDTMKPGDVATAPQGMSFVATPNVFGSSFSMMPLIMFVMGPDQINVPAYMAFGAATAGLYYVVMNWPELYLKTSAATVQPEVSGARWGRLRDWLGITVVVSLATMLVAAIYLAGSRTTSLEAWLLLTAGWIASLGLFFLFARLMPVSEFLETADEGTSANLAKVPDDVQGEPWPLALRLPAWSGSAFVVTFLIGNIVHPSRPIGSDFWQIFVPVAFLSATLFVGQSVERRRPAAVRTRDRGQSTTYLVIIALSLSLTVEHRLGWPLDTGMQGAIVSIALIAIPSMAWARNLRASEASWRLATINARVHALRLEKANLDGQLRTLQAQIEPHFLFNTLANVSALIDSSPSTARLVVDRLSDYLRTSLDRTRGGATTLGQELDSVRAYLEISAARMGHRLCWQIDAGDTPVDTPLAPLLIQPLVENAVRHGLEPEIEGGSVCVHVRPRDGGLLIEVTDTGKGMSETSGSGLGLANVRERLRALYGPAAALVLEQNEPKGLRARLEIPQP